MGDKTLISLAPKNDLEESDIYIQALNQAIEDESVYNVAITGPLGSGKSTIIESYRQLYKEDEKKHAILWEELKQYIRNFIHDLTQIFIFKIIALIFELIITFLKFVKNGLSRKYDWIAKISNGIKNRLFAKKDSKHKFINVSLANLSIEDESPETILKAIFTQIFYTESVESIPGSRFNKIKHNKHNGFYIWILIVIILSLIALGMASAYELIPEIKDKEAFLKEHFNLALVAIIGISFILYQIIKNMRLSSVSMSGDLGVEFESKDENILNDFLDELVNFFQINQYDVLFLEDLDRRRDDCSKVLATLGELNLVLNHNVKQKKKITFVYALNDSIFKEQNKNGRTKFFQAIIPVIPYNTSQSAYDHLNKLIREYTNIREDIIDKDLLLLTSLFIDDQRTLINILNEYNIYSSSIEEKYQNKLFPLVVYKNLYPEDFEQAQFNQGMIPSLFNQIEEYRNQLLKNVKNSSFSLFSRSKDHQENNIYRIKMMSQKELIDEMFEKNLFSEEILNNDYLISLVRKGYIDHSYTRYIGTDLENDTFKYLKSVYTNKYDDSIKNLDIDVEKVIQYLKIDDYDNINMLNYKLVSNYPYFKANNESLYLAIKKLLNFETNRKSALFMLDYMNENKVDVSQVCQTFNKTELEILVLIKKNHNLDFTHYDNLKGLIDDYDKTAHIFDQYSEILKQIIEEKDLEYKIDFNRLNVNSMNMWLIQNGRLQVENVSEVRELLWDVLKIDSQEVILLSHYIYKEKFPMFDSTLYLTEDHYFGNKICDIKNVIGIDTRFPTESDLNMIPNRIKGGKEIIEGNKIVNCSWMVDQFNKPILVDSDGNIISTNDVKKDQENGVRLLYTKIL